MTRYTYALTEFPTSIVLVRRLTDDILQSSISIDLLGITEEDPNCHIDFVSDLSSPDLTTLDGLVATHDPTISYKIYADIYPESHSNPSPWQFSVKSITETAPPGSPTDGDRYLVASGGTGDWTGHDDELTWYSSDDTAWYFEELQESATFYVDDENKAYVYNGSALVSAFGSGGSLDVTQISSDTSTSTSSGSFVTLADMTTTPLAGDYIVMFSAYGYGSTDRPDLEYQLFRDGTAVDNTYRVLDDDSDGGSSKLKLTMHTQAYLTGLSGSEQLEIKYQTDRGNFIVRERNMILMKVG